MVDRSLLQASSSGSMPSAFVTRSVGGVVVRVCAALVIGLVAPHVPGVEPQGDAQPGVCIVDTRT